MEIGEPDRGIHGQTSDCSSLAFLFWMRRQIMDFHGMQITGNLPNFIGHGLSPIINLRPNIG